MVVSAGAGAKVAVVSESDLHSTFCGVDCFCVSF